MPAVLERLKQWARGIRRDGLTLWIALRDPRAPWHARLLAALVVAYALSPIDLIPDFIPVLGYLDEVILLPLLIALTLRLMPPDVLTAARAEAERRIAAGVPKPRSLAGAVFILLLWLLLLLALMRWLFGDRLGF